MEAQILKQNHFSVLCLSTSFFDFRADAVVQELYVSPKKILKSGNDRRHGKLRLREAVWSAKVTHKNDRLGSILEAVLDCRYSFDNSLGIRDGASFERDVEVSANQDALVLDQMGNPVDCELAREHGILCFFFLLN